MNKLGRPYIVIVYDFHPEARGEVFRLARPDEVKDPHLVIDAERGIWGMRDESKVELKLVPFGEYIPEPPSTRPAVEKSFKAGERIVLVIGDEDAKSLEALKYRIERTSASLLSWINGKIDSAKPREPSPRR